MHIHMPTHMPTWTRPIVLMALVILISERTAELRQTDISPSAQPAPQASTWDGVYSREQATRGQAAYGAACSSCHLPDLTGSGESPALAGSVFLSGWENMSVGDLFDRIQRTMPEDNPNSLTTALTGDIVAFLLQANDFPAGTGELKNGEALKQIVIQKRK
jgi:S-disulfanyl-L-cysteine oxidoreductase SoxD